MNSSAPGIPRGEIAVLLRGEAGPIRSWTDHWAPGRVALHLAVIIAGAGLYGAAIGWWRSPVQGLYTAIKLPLILLLISGGNAMLNAMLAPLLGVNIGFRQSFLAILMSFSIAASILGSFSPLTAYLIWNSPPMTPDVWRSSGTYGAILLTNVAIIAFAGVAANLRLWQLLCLFSGSSRLAVRVLAAWLAGNLFLGSQLSWILRPFVGSPGLPVQFLRDDPFRGNFYEAVLGTLLDLFSN